MDKDQAVIRDESFAKDHRAKAKMQEIAGLPGVKRIVGLNDMSRGTHEAPVSMATATKDIVYPEFTAEVVNCGFSLLTTDIQSGDLDKRFFRDLCPVLDERSTEFTPSRDDVIGMLMTGGEYVVDQWDFDPGVLDHIENRGNLFGSYGCPLPLKEFFPPWLLWYNGIYENTPIAHLKDNHFIEFQEVGDIVDDATASKWGLSQGDIVIFIHGDYLLTYILFLHYANRAKFKRITPITGRMKLLVSKAAFHLYRTGPINFWHEWGKFANNETFTGFDVNSNEGKILITAINAAANFGHANRLLATRCLDRAISDSLGRSANIDLLWDVGHDTIQQETIDGETYWVHRKGAGNAVPGKPTPIAGSYNMRSFVGKGLESADSYLNSYDHGSSSVIDYFEKRDRLKTLDRETRLYDRSDGSEFERVKHVDPAPIEAIVDDLTEEGVLEAVAWLDPVANLGTR